MLNAAKEAWELEDGSFREDKKFLHVSTDEVYGTRDLVLMAIFTKQLRMHRTARILQARHLLICW